MSIGLAPKLLPHFPTATTSVKSSLFCFALRLTAALSATAPLPDRLSAAAPFGLTARPCHTASASLVRRKIGSREAAAMNC